MKAYLINGGLGRCISALPALLAAKDSTLVIHEGWGEIFRGVTPQNIEGTSTYLDFLIDQGGYDVVCPEPYHLNKVRMGQLNLVEAFDLLINGEVNNHTPVPFIPSADADAILARMNIPRDKPLAVLQPVGSGGFADSRSMTAAQIRQIADSMNTIGFRVIVIGEQPLLDWAGIRDIAVQPAGLTYMDALRLIVAAQAFIGCDSMGIHCAVAHGIPSAVVLGATSGSKLYPDHALEIRDPSGRRYSQQLRIGYSGESRRIQHCLTSPPIMDFAIPCDDLEAHFLNASTSFFPQPATCCK